MTASRYGILAEAKIKPGKMSEFVSHVQAHFVRQLDGREPTATRATILDASPDDPDTVRLFAEWENKGGYEAHSAPNDNVKVFQDLTEPLIETMSVQEFKMKHFQKSVGVGTKYGITVNGKAEPGKVKELVKALVGHLERQHDGREPGATFGVVCEPSPEEPDTVLLVEQWETKKDYEEHRAPNENLKALMDTVGDLWKPVIKPFTMQHFERSSPGVTPAPDGATEIKVTTNKSPGFYSNTVCSFLRGIEAKPAEEGKDEVAAKPAVENVRVSGLGDAINVAVVAATRAEVEGVGVITKVQTAYPYMESSSRGCAQILIDIKKK